MAARVLRRVTVNLTGAKAGSNVLVPSDAPWVKVFEEMGILAPPLDPAPAAAKEAPVEETTEVTATAAGPKKVVRPRHRPPLGARAPASAPTSEETAEVPSAQGPQPEDAQSLPVE